MQDADGNVPFFWGTDSEGYLVLSDDSEIVKKGCGKSFAPFPKGIDSMHINLWCQENYFPMLVSTHSEFQKVGFILVDKLKDNKL